MDLNTITSDLSVILSEAKNLEVKILRFAQNDVEKKRIAKQFMSVGSGATGGQRGHGSPSSNKGGKRAHPTATLLCTILHRTLLLVQALPLLLF